MDLSKCECDKPGMCPVFGRVMGEDPPDWEWCQHANIEDKLSFYNFTSKAPPSRKKILTDALNEYAGDHKKFMIEYLTKQTLYHNCKTANKLQSFENEKILTLLNKNTDFDINNIEILCLGHSSQQFDSIKDVDYITKVDLNIIDAGNYSENHWAEARAFISNNKLFRKKTDFIGFTTASWNLKYESFCRIDNFHNWHNSSLLSNNTVLCADMFCPCEWFKDGNNILSSFFREKHKMLAQKLLSSVNLGWDKHKNVPYSNQMIAHKDVYLKYREFLLSNNVFAKVKNFMDSFAYKYKYDTKNEIRDRYHYPKIYAYLVEMITCFWYLNQDLLYIPNAERREEWYRLSNIKDRIERI